jgi:hypothetical protein
MLNCVSCVTWCVTGFDASKRALEQLLGYEAIDTAPVSADLAASWSAPAVAGARCGLFRPASRESVLIRLVETNPVDGYKPLTCYGWNATELHVQDVNTLAERLRGSDYRILGGPRDLLENGTAVALQVQGPSGEILYLTEINGKRMQASYGKALAPVGRCFIVVLGSSKHAASMAFYGELAGRKTRPRCFPIRVLAAAHGMDTETSTFRIGSAVLEQPYRIEIDEYPDSAIARPAQRDGLPPGMAMVTFESDDIDELPSDAVLDVRTLAGPPYDRRRCALLRGPDGELLEIIEAAGA